MANSVYPRGCTFPDADWDVLAKFWYPVAYSHEIEDAPVATTLLDQRLVIWRTAAGISVANDICLHRGVPLSMGHLKGDQLICKYHGFHYDSAGQCTLIPANPQASIPRKLRLKTYPVKEAFGLVWTTLQGEEGNPDALPIFPEWTDGDYQQVKPDAIAINAAAGRQMEGFLDVAHFAWVHVESFGDRDNPQVPKYPVTTTDRGLRAEYTSTVSNFPKGLQHRAPDDFQWIRDGEELVP